MSGDDVTRARFAAAAGLLGALGDRRVAELRSGLQEILRLRGDERALDSGTGTGPIAFALSPLVGSVVGVDLVPEMIEQGRARAAEYPNVEFLVGDAYALPFPDASFDLATTGRTLHHLERPAAAIAELARVVRPGGTVLVIDQVAPEDPGAAALQEEIERLRDPSHVRTLPDPDLRGMLTAAGLGEIESRIVPEERDLDEFLALAGCTGEAARPPRDLAAGALGLPEGEAMGLRAEGDGLRFTIRVGWYRASRGA